MHHPSAAANGGCAVFLFPANTGRESECVALIIFAQITRLIRTVQFVFVHARKARARVHALPCRRWSLCDSRSVLADEEFDDDDGDDDC